MTETTKATRTRSRPVWETGDEKSSFGAIFMSLLYGLMIILSALVGSILVLGGGYLATLGGSWLYLLFGLGFLGVAVSFYRQSGLGVILLLVMALASLIWGFVESDGNRFAMIPRMGIPFGFAAVGLILWPLLKDISKVITAIAAAALVAVAVICTMILPDNTFEDDDLIAEVSARTSSPFEVDELDRDWIAYGGTRGSVRYSSLDQITPENVKDLGSRLGLQHGRHARRYG